MKLQWSFGCEKILLSRHQSLFVYLNHLQLNLNGLELDTKHKNTGNDFSYTACVLIINNNHNETLAKCGVFSHLSCTQ